MQIQIKVKRNCKVNRANIFAEKIKVEGRVTFQNIFSSIMADFRAVVSVLPCSPTNKGKNNLCDCAEKGNGHGAFNIKKQRLRLQIDWRQKRRTFQFNFFLWVILHILHFTFRKTHSLIPPFTLTVPSNRKAI